MSPLQILASYYGGISGYPNQAQRGQSLFEMPGNTHYSNMEPSRGPQSTLPQGQMQVPEEWLSRVQAAWPDSVFTRGEPATIDNVTAPQMIRDAYNRLMGFEVPAPNYSEVLK